MKDKKLAAASRYRVGDKHRLELTLLSDRPELERIMQADDTGAVELTPFFVLKTDDAKYDASSKRCGRDPDYAPADVVKAIRDAEGATDVEVPISL